MADIRRTGQLTDFVGTNEDPLSDGGNWASAGVSSGGAMARKGNLAVNSILLGATLGHSYWTPEAFPDSGVIEVWGVAVGGGGGAAGDGWRLGFFISPGNGFTGLFFSALGVSTGIRRYTGGTFVQADNFVGGGSTAGGAAMWLFRKTQATLEWWTSIDSGANWTLDCSAFDSHYLGSDFYLVIGAEDQGGGQIDGWSSIGGGNPIRRRPQIYRWVTN